MRRVTADMRHEATLRDVENAGYRCVRGDGLAAVKIEETRDDAVGWRAELTALKLRFRLLLLDLRDLPHGFLLLHILLTH